MNAGIARTTEKVAALKRENSRLRLEAAKLGSSERIQRAAADLGLVLPAPGEVRYLAARPGDAALALKRMSAPATGPAPSPAAAGAGRAGAHATTEPAPTTTRDDDSDDRRPTPAEPATPAPTATDARLRRPRPSRRGTRRVRLVERRIGFLFALFLALLVLAAARATWLGTVESRDLGNRALTQQVEEMKVSARRGTITDRNGDRARGVRGRRRPSSRTRS